MAKGGDGPSPGIWKRELKKTSAQGVPQFLSADAKCGACATTTRIQGKPGKFISSFTCRSCSTVNQVSGNLGFEFQGMN